MAATTIGEAFVRVRPDTSHFAADTRRGIRSSMAGIGRITVGAGAFIGITGVAAALEKGVGTAVTFERGLRNVNSIAGLTDRQLGNVSDQLLRLAETTGQAPETLTKGLYDIVSSGFAAADAVKILAVSTKAASAGLTDTATATNAIDAALNAYHLSASEAQGVSDVLFQTVNKGVLTFGELAQNMGDLVPAAAPLGITLKEVGAAIATVTLQGVPAAEAATRVKNTMLQLASPSKELTKFLKANGFASAEAAIQSRGYAGILELLNKRTQGSVSATSKLFPEMRAALGVIGLTGKNAALYTNILKSMDSATAGAGMTQHAFAEQAKSVSFRAAQARAAFQVTSIQLTAEFLPALNSVADGAINFAHWLEHSEDVHSAVRAGVAASTSLYHALAHAVATVGPPLRTVAQAGAEVGKFLGAGGILAAALAFKAATIAASGLSAASVRYLALKEQVIRAEAGHTASLVASTGAVGGNTAALVANSAAAAGNAAANSGAAAARTAGTAASAGSFLQGAGGKIVSPYSSPQAFARAEKELAAMRNTGRAASAAAPRLALLGAGLRSLVSPSTVAAAAIAGVAYGIYRIVTRESDFERANDSLRSSVDTLRGSLINLQGREQELSQLRLDIPVQRAAVAAAHLALEQDKHALATTKAVKGSYEYRLLVNQVATDVAQLNVATDQLNRTRTDEVEKTQQVAAAQRKTAAARKTEVDAAVLLGGKLRASVAENIREVQDQDFNQSLVSRTELVRFTRMKEGTAAIKQFTAAVREDADAAKNQAYPQLKKNLDLLADYTQTIGRIPDRATVDFILRVHGDREMRELIADLRNAQGLGESAGQAAADSPRGTAHNAAAVAAQRAAQAAKDSIVTVSKSVDDAGTHLQRQARIFSFKVTDSLTDAAEQIRDAQKSVRDTIEQGKLAVNESVQSAKQNLNALSQSLASSISDFLDKLKPPKPVVAQKLTGPLLAEFKALKAELAAGGADAEEIQRKAQQLSTTLQARASLAGAGATSQTADQALTKRKDRITRELADLSDLRNKGALSEEQFEKRVTRLLRQEGITRANIRKKLGVAAADEFTATVTGLREQGRAIAAGPQRRGTGLEAAIVRPLEALKDAQEANADAQLSVTRAQRDLARQSLAELRSQSEEFRKQTRKLDQIEKKTGRPAPRHTKPPKGQAAVTAANAIAAGLDH